MQTVMNNRAGITPGSQIPRSLFKRPSGNKLTFDAGYLIPIFIDECLPGDVHKMKATGFARLSTPVFPVMDNMFLDIHTLCIPIRVLWDNFVKFMGEQTDPGDSITYVMPKIGQHTPVAESLSDYLGLPLSYVDEVAALFFRFYHKAWNDLYRDENLQDSVYEYTGDVDVSVTNYSLLRRGKRKDYFTSLLPWPQKGDSVELPLGTVAPIEGIGTATTSPTHTGLMAVKETGGVSRDYAFGTDVTSATNRTWMEFDGDPGYPKVYADLSEATAATINQFRQAFQIQKLLEKDARTGTRYPEVVRGHFDVVVPDFRTQRTEIIQVSSHPIVISPIAQTSESGSSPQGNLAAMGTVSARHSWSKGFVEHSLVMMLASVRADLTYQQGTERHWYRNTRYDYYWPSLAQIGEQAVYTREIYNSGPTNDDVLGYGPRYDEYRGKLSKICGKFRSDYATSLDAWHLSEDFAAAPLLNDTFIQSNPPVDRVVAVPSEPHFISDWYFDLESIRPMPLHGVPGLLDRL